MKMKLYTRIVLALALAGMLLAGCEDYLDIKPKGVKVPATIEDFRGFLNLYMVFTSGSTTREILTNEFSWGSDPSSINNAPDSKCNYLWLEDEDRISYTETDIVYDENYKGIYYANLVANEVPKLDFRSKTEEDEGKMLVAQARVKRVLHYFHLINTYAKMYNASTAQKDGGVPLITTSDDFETVVPQKTVAEIYDFMVNELKSSIPYLPEKEENIVLCSKAAGYALLARVQLFMKDFDNALANAEQALERENFIFDMVDYHKKHVGPGKNIQGERGAFSGLPQFAFYDGMKENIFVVCGHFSHLFQGLTAEVIPMKDSIGNQNYVRDSSRFEPGDTRFLCNFYRDEADQLYSYRRLDNVNGGGIRTTEVYLMRAECYARRGELSKAMEDVNAIRRKRIISYWVPGLPEAYEYKDATASTIAEAIKIIRHERDVELMGSNMMFFDLRRFNTEEAYKQTLIKTDFDGQKHTLEPDSDLWILPFPKAVTKYNSKIKQNTSI